MTTEVLKLAAFSDGDRGGNPAGVWIGDALPEDAVMQQIAADIGFPKRRSLRLSKAAGGCGISRRWQKYRFAGTRPSPWAQRWRRSKAMACFS